jgi:hypothetical protein
LRSVAEALVSRPSQGRRPERSNAAAFTEKRADSDISALYSDYGKPVPSKTPQADESVDVSELPGG